MPIHNKKRINLIPQDEFESSNFGRILKWALSTFRIMVIVTELIVMSAFLSRFWLDAKNSDLNEEINTSKSQVIAYKDVENEFRSIQKKIALVKSIYSEPKVSSIITDVTKFIPESITLNSISDTEDLILMKASSFSEESIAQFINNLDASESFSDTTLSQVSSNIDNNVATSFTVLTKIKK